MLTHHAREADVTRALSEISALDVVARHTHADSHRRRNDQD
jgi:hypothetical protein